MQWAQEAESPTWLVPGDGASRTLRDRAAGALGSPVGPSGIQGGTVRRIKRGNLQAK